MEGFFHAHVGWLFKDRFADPQIYCRYLLNDPLVVWVDRTFLLWVTLSLAIPFLLGGWTGLLWGGLVRIFIGHHISFSVNSICHTFGKRDFETSDSSRNQWLVGILAFVSGKAGITIIMRSCEPPSMGCTGGRSIWVAMLSGCWNACTWCMMCIASQPLN
jgi:hypothetical protein